MICIEEAKCYVESILMTHGLFTVVMVACLAVFTLNHSNITSNYNVPKSEIYIAGCSILLTAIFQLVSIIRAIYFANTGLQQSLGTDIFFVLGATTFGLTKAVRYFYIYEVTQSAYTTVEIDEENRHIADQAVKPICLCCEINPQKSCHACCGLRKNQIFWACVYFGVRTLAALSLFVEESMNQVHLLLSVMAIFADLIYLSYLTVFVLQRFVRYKLLRTDERILRATVTNAIITIASLSFCLAAIVFSPGYNAHLPNNFQFWLLDLFALVYNVVTCFCICANYVDFFYDKLCCCCRSYEMKKSFTPIVEPM